MVQLKVFFILVDYRTETLFQYLMVQLKDISIFSFSSIPTFQYLMVQLKVNVMEMLNGIT